MTDLTHGLFETFKEHGCETVRISRTDWPDGLSRITVQAHLPGKEPSDD